MSLLYLKHLQNSIPVSLHRPYNLIPYPLGWGVKVVLRCTNPFSNNIHNHAEDNLHLLHQFNLQFNLHLDSLNLDNELDHQSENQRKKMTLTPTWTNTWNRVSG